MEIKVSAWLSWYRPGFIYEALGLQSSCRVANTLLRLSTDAYSTRASLPPLSLIVPIEEYNKEEAPDEDANTRPSTASGTSETGCLGPAACGALRSHRGPLRHVLCNQGHGQGTPDECHVRQL